MPDTVVSAPPAAARPSVSQPPTSSRRASSASRVMRAAVMVTNLVIIGIWILLEVAHLWRRLRTWMD